MIIVRAPMRISFVGGGTDIADFYHKHPGRVISTAIDKYVYVAINRTPLISKISARYGITETVEHSSLLEHTRIKAALLDLEIYKGLEIASFASLPSKTGLGSSSSFSVALLKGLYAYSGKKLTKEELAEAACRLEIKLVGEPIGKQDQYAATFGGFNVFQFNRDDTVDVHPVLLNYKSKLAFEDHLLLFFTGLTRTASSVLTEQKKNTGKNLQTLKKMANSVDEFSERLLKEDFKGLGKMLHEGWLMKKRLASNMSNSLIDDMYGIGMKNGAWGGKVLGAGGGGCILFITPPAKKKIIREKMKMFARKHELYGITEIPVHFVQSGAEILYNGDQEFR